MWGKFTQYLVCRVIQNSAECHRIIPLEKRGEGVEYFGSRDIGGGLALISGFWGDLRKKGE